MHHVIFPLFLLAFLLPHISATQLSDARLQKVYNVMNAISMQSWENGTKAEAILEHDYANLSVYSPTPALPLPNPLPSQQISFIVSIAQTTLQNRPATNTSAQAHGGSALLADEAAGDPASLGVSVLLANVSTGNAEVNGVGYGYAATEELSYLLYDAPRTSSGAISHRADQAQLWSDFIYMGPPFFAYYGALTNNQSLLQLAYDQCSLYRSALSQPSGLWTHISGGSGTSDSGEWATGNAWAAAGMVRVLATIKQSSFAGSMESQMGDLQNWAGDILGAAQNYITSDGLLRNYINDTTSFEDASGSALMAATGLRMATLNLTNTYVNSSLTLLSAVSEKVNSTGYLTQVVDPNDFTQQGSQSPEGQSFVVLAYAAYDEWDKMGRPGEVQGGKTPLGKESGAVRTAGLAVAWSLGEAFVLAELGLGLRWMIA